MPVRPPSLRSIAAFEAAARHSSFTRAADELNLTPGAISHAIKALEERIGQQLFERSGRAVSLTAAGQTFAARIRLSLRLLSDAFETMPRRGRERLVISTTSGIAQKILAPHLDALQRSSPGTSFDIRTGNALADFDDGIDLAIRFGPGGWRGLQSRFLGQETLFPVVSSHYNHGDWPMTQGELAGHRLIHHPESNWRLWLDPDDVDPISSCSAFHLDDAVAVIEAAVAGAGIALARGRFVDQDLRSGRLNRILKRSVPAEYGYWAVWDASSTKLESIAAFVAAVEPLFNVEDPSTED